jgi:predicted ribosome quality control (RQC) complex YloA/Tae2 family protein
MKKRIKLFNESSDKFPNIKKVNIDGFDVYIGRDARSNDYLTFQIAKDDDIWLHIKGYPGSHVVIKINNNIPDQYLIKKVSELVKKNSKAKNENKAKIIYCKRKFVSKNLEHKTGQVSVDHKNSYEIDI